MNRLQGALKHRGGEVVRLASDYKRGIRHTVSVPTGFEVLDSMGGLKRGIVTVVGAHSGVGKSTFAMHLVRSAAVAGVHTMWFSMEDPLPDTLDRIFAMETALDSLELSTGKIDPDTLKKRLVAIDLGWTDNVKIDDRRHSPSTLDRAIRDEVRPGETGLIVVDYAQVFHGDVRTGSLEPVIRRLTAELAGLAKEFNCAVVLFSQLRREALERGERVYHDVQSRTGSKRSPLSGYVPATEDLAWSSALLQYAKAVWLLDRPALWAKKHGLPETDAFHVHVAKANFGRTGTVYMKCQMAEMRLWGGGTSADASQ